MNFIEHERFQVQESLMNDNFIAFDIDHMMMRCSATSKESSISSIQRLVMEFAFKTALP